MEKQKKFHGLGPYDPETGETKPAGQKTYSEVFAETLVKLADANEKVVAITAAMPNGTALDLFQPHHPKRYFDVGIAEEHAVIFAAGMATQGYQAVLRDLLDVLAARVRSDRARCLPAESAGGLLHGPRRACRGDDGPTHHGLFDISYLRGIPNIVHMVPKDEDELADMLYTAMLHDGPSRSAIRAASGRGRR